MNLGAQKLRQVMCDLSLRQADIAEEAGASQPQVSTWLAGLVKPSRRAAVLIHRRWGIDPLAWDAEPESEDPGPEAA